MKTTKTYEVKIYIAGNLHTIEHNCRRFCLIGLCVTVTPTTFIFTGGSETGACVGFMNYARFPLEHPNETQTLDEKAIQLAEVLMSQCAQRSCSVVTPEKTYYLENPEVNVRR